MSLKIVIVVSLGVTIAIGLTAWAVVGPLVASLNSMVYQPNIRLTDESFEVGACRVGAWPWDRITDVQANLTFRNTGNAPGRATVTFTEDGNPIAGSPSDFLVQAGQTTPQNAQIQVGDCMTHTYHAQISSVSTA